MTHIMNEKCVDKYIYINIGNCLLKQSPFYHEPHAIPVSPMKITCYDIYTWNYKVFWRTFNSI